MGQKTSIYLADDMAARVKASGLTPAELIRRGLDAAEHDTSQTEMRDMIREEVRQALRDELGAILNREG
jgi:hypothetical protein